MPPLYAELTFFAKVLELYKTTNMLATYKINGMPIGLAWVPSLIPYWLQRLKIKGRQVGGIISFTMEEVKEGLKKDKVGHIADFLGTKSLWFNAGDCIKQD